MNKAAFRGLGSQRRPAQDPGQAAAIQDDGKFGLEQFIGKSPTFLAEFNKIPATARCLATVLILGETGTGKEMCARAIHSRSSRSKHPFIPVNCGAFPSDLIENELFGHAAGAFMFASGVMGRFPVEGNVICGGYEHVVYKADWHVLGTGDRIRAIPAGDSQVRAHLDVGDLVSEKQNGYTFDHPSNGWTDMRILPDPADPRRDMFDGGRRIAVARSERFIARGLTPGAPAHLVVRAAPDSKTRVHVRIQGADAGTLELERTGGWIEVPLAIPGERVSEAMVVELTNEGPGDFVDFHEWLTQ